MPGWLCPRAQPWILERVLVTGETLQVIPPQGAGHALGGTAMGGEMTRGDWEFIISCIVSVVIAIAATVLIVRYV